MLGRPSRRARAPGTGQMLWPVLLGSPTQESPEFGQRPRTPTPRLVKACQGTTCAQLHLRNSYCCSVRTALMLRSAAYEAHLQNVPEACCPSCKLATQHAPSPARNCKLRRKLGQGCLHNLTYVVACPVCAFLVLDGIVRFSGGETVKSRVTRPRLHANGTRSEGLRDLQAAQVMLQHCNMHPIKLHKSKGGLTGSFSASAVCRVCRHPPRPACDADAAV